MLLETQNIQRLFIIKNKEGNITLDDPNPNYTVEEVKRVYLNSHPQLLNSSMNYKGYQSDVNALVYEFESVAGTKA